MSLTVTKLARSLSAAGHASHPRKRGARSGGSIPTKCVPHISPGPENFVDSILWTLGESNPRLRNANAAFYH